MTTNATMVNEKVAQALAALGHLENINVSLDSPDPAIYEAIRGGPLDRAMAGLTHLSAALGPSRLTVSSVMMRSNAESLLAFPPLLAGMGIRKYVLQGLVDYAPGLEREEPGRGFGEYIERVERACRESGVELILELPERTAVLIRTPADAGPSSAPPRAETDTKQCFAPWDTPVVDKDGRVFPCCYAMTHGEAVLGRLQDESVDAIWYGKNFNDFRKALVDGRTTPSICRACTVVPVGPHPYRELSAEIVHDESRLSGSTALRLVVRNTGAATWSKRDQVHLGTASPRDGHSVFFHPSWLGRNRIGTFREEAVPPGETATFDFLVMPSAEVAEETFQVVVEHRGWLPATRFALRPGQLEAGPSEPADGQAARSRGRRWLRAIGLGS